VALRWSSIEDSAQYPQRYDGKARRLAQRRRVGPQSVGAPPLSERALWLAADPVAVQKQARSTPISARRDGYEGLSSFTLARGLKVNFSRLECRGQVLSGFPSSGRELQITD